MTVVEIEFLDFTIRPDDDGFAFNLNIDVYITAVDFNFRILALFKFREIDYLCLTIGKFNGNLVALDGYGIGINIAQDFNFDSLFNFILRFTIIGLNECKRAKQ